LVGGELLDVPPREGQRGMHALLAELPDGVYSGLRTFPGARFLALRAHLDRAERSASALGFSFESERGALVAALQRTADEAAPVDLALRFDALPEPAELDGVRARLWIAAAALEPVPRRFLEEGVGIQWTRELFRERPLVKTTAFVRRRHPYPLARQDAYEHVMLDAQGRALEGTSSNFFAVRGDHLLTAGEGVLEGITRAIVLELAPLRGLRIDLDPPRIAQTGSWTEAFLTSSTRGLVPIVACGGERIGDGRSGPHTRALLEAYGEHAEREARRAL
jgi:branched-subunit amino acid aminotransferase/4-amino-4-deoxychorismate lyase